LRVKLRSEGQGYRQVFSNSFYLSINYVLNFAIPIVITPYLIQVIGLSKYGLISVSLALCQYFNVLVDYGFNLTATREISLNQGSLEKISKITCSVLLLKLCILIIGFFVYVLIIFSFESFRNSYLLFLLSFTLVIGQGISTNWFFQGIERIQVMAVGNIVFKLSAAISIFFIIREESDYIWINFILGIGNILASASLVSYIFFIAKFKFILPNYEDLIFSLKSGWNIFEANFYINLYNNSNVLIINLFVSNDIVGIYSVIDKVINVIRQIIGVLLQSIYPTACKMAAKSLSALLRFLLPIWTFAFLGVLTLTCIIYFYSTEIVTFIIGINNELAVYYLGIFSLIPVIVFLSTFFVIIILVFDYSKIYKRIFLSAAIVNIVSNLILSRMYGIKGTIMAVYISEFLILIITFLIYQNINLFKRNVN
jgi:polysaccharide transporter, PST family